MPTGIPNKPKTVKHVINETSPAPTPEAKKLEPLGPGQAYFEAPDGTVIIGEETADRLWYRQGNGGKGMYINKKR